MTKKKQDNHGVLKAVVAGAAVIGGAALAAVALSNEDNREKIKDEAKKIRDRGEDFLASAYEEAGVQFEELKKKVQKWVEEGKKSEEYKKVLDAMDNVADKLAEAKEASGDNVDDVVKNVKKAVADLKKEFDEMQDDVKEQIKEKLDEAA